MAITAANMLADVVAIADGLPEGIKKTATVYNRTSGDTYGTGESYVAFRVELVMADLSGLNRKSCRWTLLGTTGQTTLPKRGSKIVVDGVAHHCESVSQEFGGLVHQCDVFVEV